MSANRLTHLVQIHYSPVSRPNIANYEIRGSCLLVVVDELERKHFSCNLITNNKTDTIAILRRIRDLLLLKLISGEVDVSEMDIEVPG